MIGDHAVFQRDVPFPVIGKADPNSEVVVKWQGKEFKVKAGADGKWSVMVWGKNLGNKYYWNNVVTSSDFTARWAGMPATYGISWTTKTR